MAGDATSLEGPRSVDEAGQDEVRASNHMYAYSVHSFVPVRDPASARIIFENYRSLTSGF